MTARKRILGIDPGSRVCGYGLIESSDKQWSMVTCGTWTLKADTVIERLYQLQNHVHDCLVEHKPDHLAIEDVFVHKNADSALKLGQARGVVLSEIIRMRIPIFTYAPRQVKQAIVGKGAASKEQVQTMVKLLLKTEVELALDASDALAIALTHGNIESGLAKAMNTTAFSRSRKGKRSKEWQNHDWKNKRDSG